jgi:hypothetical protein
VAGSADRLRGFTDRQWQVLAQPDAVAYVHVQQAGRPVELTVIAIAPDMVVLQSIESGGRVHLTWRRFGDLPGLIDDLTGLTATRDPIGPETGWLTVSGRTWLLAQELAGDPERGRQMLRMDGLSAASSHRLADVLEALTRRCQVTTVHQTGPRRLDGTSVAWIATGDGDTWEVVAPKLAQSGDAGRSGQADIDSVEVKVSPSSSARVHDEIRKGLPSSLREKAE